MWHRVKDLSSEQRLVIESLIGRRLREDEGLNIQPARILQEAPTGEDRVVAYGQYLGDLARIGDRAKGVSEGELEAVIDDACSHARHPRS